MANSGPNFTSKLDKHFKKFKDFGYDTKQIEEASDYEIVRALLDDAWVSIDKCDTEPYDLNDDEIYKLTLKYVSLLLEEILTVMITIEKNELKMDSAPGVIYAMHKIKTKLEALQSQIFKDLMGRHDYIPLAGIATKREFLCNEDLLRHKVRTTFTTPLDLLMKTKLFFQQQNENLKAVCDENWIKYGMTKQYGGLDEFFKELEQFTHVFQSDASGYDRTAYLLDVYYMRWKFLQYPDELEDLLFWTMFHNIFPFCVALDGTIFMRQCGNNSGANNTASDNSILHLIIVIYLFIFSWHKKHSVFPTLADIEENANLGLYSDDKLGGANFSKFGWDDIESFQKDEMEVYRRFNMVIKPSSILVTQNKPGQPIDKRHEFLGSSASFNELYGKYYGYPRIGKICSSITRKGLEPLSEKEYFHKVMQLLLLSVPEPWLFDKIKEFSQFLIKTSNHKEELRHIEEIYLGKNHSGILAIHFGYELSLPYIDPLFSEFLRHQSDDQRYAGLDRQSNINFTTVSDFLVASGSDLLFEVYFFFIQTKNISGGWKDLKSNILIATMQGVRKADKTLDNLASNATCELTKDGANFLRQRFDPYHDLPMKPTGYTDAYNGYTVSRCIKKTVTISATSSEGPVPTTTWNCHIWSTPIARPVILTQRVSSTANSNNLFPYNVSGTAPTLSLPYGGVMMQRSDSGTWGYPALVGSTNLVGQLALNDTDLVNVMRITSMGFEVIDETAELYQQGTLTAYRQNQSQARDISVNMIGANDVPPNTTYAGAVSAQIVKFPPENTAAAMLIPNTKQWKVKEGAYAVTDFHDIELPMTEPELISPGLIRDNQDETIAQVVIDWMAQPVGSTGVAIPGTTPAATLNIPKMPPNRITPTNQTGVFLTGLNPLASITVNAIWYVECAPSGEDEELLSLCSQSPMYDATSMMLISKMRSMAPPVVKRKENFLGDWFVDGVKSIIQKTMPWLSNAQVVGNQVVKWIDTASTNNGYINPQSFVKGSVSEKVAKEKAMPQAIVLKGPARPKRAAPLNKPIGRGPKNVQVVVPANAVSMRRNKQGVPLAPHMAGQFKPGTFKKAAYKPTKVVVVRRRRS